MNKISRREAAKRLGAAASGLALVPLLTSSCASKREQKAAERPKRPRAFKKSDVVFAFVFTPEEYKMWGANVLFGSSAL